MVAEPTSDRSGKPIAWRLVKSADLLGVVADSCYTDPCLRSSSRRLCSSTSCVRQNGHQSAERKNTSIAPRGPMTDCRLRMRPVWSLRLKSGTCCPTCGQLADLDLLARLLRRLSGVRTTHTENRKERGERRQITASSQLQPGQYSQFSVSRCFAVCWFSLLVWTTAANLS